MQNNGNKYKDMSPSEKQCFNNLNDLQDRILLMGLMELSNYCNVSTATINRTLKKMGYVNLKEYKSEIDIKRQYLPSTHNDISNFEQMICELISTYDQNLINKAAKEIYESSKIYIIGFGISNSIALDLSLHVHKLLKNVVCLNDSEMLDIIKSTPLDGQELIIYISYSGGDFDMEKLSIEQRYIRTQLLITSKTNCALAKHCDLILSTCTNLFDDDLNSRIPLNIITTKILLALKKMTKISN